MDLRAQTDHDMHTLVQHRTCRRTCARSRRRSRATRAATGSTSTRRSSRSSTPTTSTRSRPTAASRPATRTGRSAWSTRSCKKGYDYGLSKIYEMVINNDPCYAYLMRCNHTVDQKLVMAHVYGHCDFFKNNAYFAHTNRKMMDEMANHGDAHPPLRRAVRRGRGRGVHGPLHVDRRPDRHPLDRHPPPRRRRRATTSRRRARRTTTSKPTRFKSKDYMDDYINPREALKAEEEERKKLKEQRAPQLPRAAREGRAAVPDRARAAQALAARRALDRPRRGVLLLPAGPDEDHERGLGQLLALAPS